jgi:predicted MPP superfamily phosphohydrolase
MWIVGLLIPSMFILDLLVWMMGDRVLRRAPRPDRWRAFYAAFMAVQLGSLLFIIFGRVASSRTDEFLPRSLLSAVFVWHFIVLPAAAVIVIAARFTLPRKHAAPVVADSAATPPVPGPNRRDFLRSLAIAAPPVATVLTTGVAMSQQQEFRIRSFDLPLRQLPSDLDGLTIAQVSDIHVGRFTEEPVVTKIVEATNALRADLVLLTGDLINHALADLPAGLDAVKRMDARFGIYMIEGNHDLFESRAKFERTVKETGVPLLLNESATLSIRGQAVQLLGLKWGSANSNGSINSPSQRGDAAIADSMGVLMKQLQPGAFPILMAHHPHAFDLAAQAGIPLTLAGHTHGGQLMASPQVGFGPLMFRYWSGLYAKDESKLIVSNGVGNWFPLRINAPAEIVKITLRRSTV